MGDTSDLSASIIAKYRCLQNLTDAASPCIRHVLCGADHARQRAASKPECRHAFRQVQRRRGIAHQYTSLRLANSGNIILDVVSRQFESGQKMRIEQPFSEPYL